MIHDKTDEPYWTDTVEDWEDEFDHNDVVVAQDPQERLLGGGGFLVSRIDHTNKREHVEQLGLFWKQRAANRFARAFNDDVQEARSDGE